MKLGLVQMSMGADVASNLDKAIGFSVDLADRGAELILLPELFGSEYFCKEESAVNFALLAEEPDGATYRRFASLARAKKVSILISIFERRAPGLHHNSVILIDSSGERVALYRKSHIPDDPGFHEKFYFAPGDTGYIVHPVAGMKVGMLICWDQWFPEAARSLALRGAELIVIPTAIGYSQADKAAEGQRQIDAWITAQRAHSISNGLYLAAANRVGLEGSIEFWGSSFVSDPFGSLIGAASRSSEETLLVSIEPELIARTRAAWPFLRDRRIDLASDLEKLFID